jgi:hypothetical protein
MGERLKGEIMKGHRFEDPKGLIREAFRIDGITVEECRSIYLDWALSLPDHFESKAASATLLTVYEAENPDHPMTGILREGATAQARPRRRGGWKSRPRD